MDIVTLGNSVMLEGGKPNLEVIKRCAKDINEVLEEEKFDLVVVHGVGGLGEKLGKAVKGEKQVGEFINKGEAAAEVNRQVIDALRSEGLPAVAVHTRSCIIQENKKIVTFYTGVVKRLVELGTIPVIYSTVVTDRKLGASVCSEDAIVPALARAVQADLVLLGGDAEGILDKNKELIKEIDDNNFEAVIGEVLDEAMRNKIMKIKEKPCDAQYIVFDLRNKGLLKELLDGKQGVGTKIKLESLVAAENYERGAVS